MSHYLKGSIHPGWLAGILPSTVGIHKSPRFFFMDPGKLHWIFHKKITQTFPQKKKQESAKYKVHSVCALPWPQFLHIIFHLNTFLRKNKSASHLHEREEQVPFRRFLLNKKPNIEQKKKKTRWFGMFWVATECPRASAVASEMGGANYDLRWRTWWYKEGFRGLQKTQWDTQRDLIRLCIFWICLKKMDLKKSPCYLGSMLVSFFEYKNHQTNSNPKKKMFQKETSRKCFTSHSQTHAQQKKQKISEQWASKKKGEKMPQSVPPCTSYKYEYGVHNSTSKEFPCHSI